MHPVMHPVTLALHNIYHTLHPTTCCLSQQPKLQEAANDRQDTLFSRQQCCYCICKPWVRPGAHVHCCSAVKNCLARHNCFPLRRVHDCCSCRCLPALSWRQACKLGASFSAQFCVVGSLVTEEACHIRITHYHKASTTHLIALYAYLLQLLDSCCCCCCCRRYC
jgi:hypothetical protein